MKVRAVDGAGDWLFGKGQNDYAQKNAAIAQLIAMRLKSFLGDCFFDNGAGIDWLNQLGAKDQTALNLSIASTLLNTPDVTGIVQLKIALDSRTRKITISYVVTTTYSTVSNTTSFSPNTV